MKIRTVKYHIEEGFKGLFKNSLMTLASVATVGACAFILITSLCIVINLDYMLEQVENNVGISVFIGDDATEAEVLDIQQGIEEIEHVVSVDYVSEEDALNWAKDKWGSDSDILMGLEKDNPFPRSFEITLDGVKYQKDVIDKLESLQLSVEKEMLTSRGLLDTGDDNNSTNQSETTTEQQASEQTTETLIEVPTVTNEIITADKIGKDDYRYIGIEKIKHAQKESQMLMTMNTALRIISVILISIMSVISVAIIMNTIKLTVFIRKNEINIMKYVGATDWFIRWPFIVEGIIIGLLGAFIPTIICWLSYSNVIVLIQDKLSFLTSIAQLKPSSEMFTIILPVTLLLGAILGAFGSITSIRKHLNV